MFTRDFVGALLTVAGQVGRNMRADRGPTSGGRSLGALEDGERRAGKSKHADSNRRQAGGGTDGIIAGELDARGL